MSDAVFTFTPANEGSPTPVFTPELARHGACYRILFGMVNPDAAVDGERITEVRRKIDAIKAWAETQEPEFFASYTSAAEDILARANSIYENNKRSRIMMDLIPDLPHPPPDI